MQYIIKQGTRYPSNRGFREGWVDGNSPDLAYESPMVVEGIGIHFQYGGEFNRAGSPEVYNLPESLLDFIFSPAGDNP